MPMRLAGCGEREREHVWCPARLRERRSTILLGFIVKIRLLITLTLSLSLEFRSFSELCVRLKLKVFVANQSY